MVDRRPPAVCGQKFVAAPTPAVSWAPSAVSSCQRPFIARQVPFGGGSTAVVDWPRYRLSSRAPFCFGAVHHHSPPLFFCVTDGPVRTPATWSAPPPPPPGFFRIIKNQGGGTPWASQPRRYRVPGQPLLNRHQVGGVSRSPDGLFAQQEWEPIRGRPTVRGKRAYGGRPGQRVEEQGTWAAQKHSEAGDGRPVDRGVWTAKTVKRPRQQPAHPQYANYWAPLTRKRHTMPHSAQSQHANYWAPRTRKRHQQEHWPQRPTESSDPTQHAKGRTGDRPGPRKGATTRRNVTQGDPSPKTPPPLPRPK